MGSTKQPCASLDHLHKTVTKPMHCFEPSLTLSLSASNHRDPDPNKKHVVRDRGVVFPHNSSVISGGCSSFSNMSVKREREVGSEESERVSNGNNYSRVMSATSVDEVEDDDVCHVNGRKKLRLTKPQSDLLEEAFKLHSSLSPKQKQELARKLKLRPRQVEVWFQNRRARSKLKQTEMEFEHLKKICDKLTCENQKIQKEIQELKAFKSSEPFYMQLSTASLTLCPSCERIGDTKSSIAKNPFTMAANPQFLNSFTNPSSAC